MARREKYRKKTKAHIITVKETLGLHWNTRAKASMAKSFSLSIFLRPLWKLKWNDFNCNVDGKIRFLTRFLIAVFATPVDE